MKLLLYIYLVISSNLYSKGIIDESSIKERYVNISIEADFWNKIDSNIKEIEFVNCKFKNFSLIKPFINLEKLVIIGGEGISLKDICEFKQLVHLQLPRELEGDAKLLLNLKKLKYLYAPRIKLKNISAISKIALETLYTPGSDIDTSFISKISTLKYLDIASCKLYNLDCCKALRNLISLNASKNFIEDLSPLSGCLMLDSLRLELNIKLKDESPLLQLKKIRYLDIRGTKINPEKLKNLNIPIRKSPERFK